MYFPKWKIFSPKAEDKLRRGAVDEIAERALGCTVGNHSRMWNNARRRHGKDNRGTWGKDRSRCLGDVQSCVNIDLENVVPYVGIRILEALQLAAGEPIAQSVPSRLHVKTEELTHPALFTMRSSPPSFSRALWTSS